MTPEEEAKSRELMREIASVLAEVFPGLGFCLLLFEFGGPGAMNYIANARREDVIKVMEEFIDKTKDSWNRDRDEGTFGAGGKQ